MQKEKVRIYILARELDMESKDLLDLCKAHGIDVKNQLSSVEPEVRDQIVALLKKGPAMPVKPASAPLVPPPPQRVPTLSPAGKPPVLGPAPRREQETPPPRTAAAGTAPAAPTFPSTEIPKKPVTTATLPPAPIKLPEAPSVARPPESASRAPETPVSKTPEPAARTPEKAPEPHPPARPAETPPPASVPQPPPAPVAPAAAARAAETPPRQPETPAPRRQPEPPAAPAAQAAPPTPGEPQRSAGSGNTGGVRPPHAGQRMRDLNRPAPTPPGAPRPPAQTPAQTGGDAGRQQQRRDRPPPKIGHGRIAPPPPQPQPKAKQEAPKAPPKSGPTKLMEIPDDLKHLGDTPNLIEQIIQKQQPPKPVAPTVPVPEEESDDEDSKGKKKKGPGALPGREARHKERSERQQKRKAVGEVVDPKHASATALLDLDEDRPRPRRVEKKKIKQKPTELRKGKVPIELPITVRSLSEAIGVRSGELLMKLMGQGMPPTININSSIDPEMAEILAVSYNCELDVKRPLDPEERLLEEQKKPDNPEDLVLRAPVVTIMGHVDHGKTSLLDKIRKSNVVATEAGGITQVIRAWRVDHNGKPITFLDTPGHEAFTKMRARGANVTDIAVIVVAADDGVMPQTEEAISHAKAAGVAIVVAINKVDLPNANLRKTEQQLYGLGLIPDTMGGDVPFVQTSAATGKGIDDLLETLSLVAELKELKANPHKPATGTCLEAYLSEGEGVLATILVRDGSLNRGDVVLCGASSGRVRAMYDDLGRPLQSAGPSVPVRIAGLDEIPNADDPFMVVPDLTTGADIAEKRKARRRAAEASSQTRAPLTIDSLSEQKITELKVILKAEARGSIEAIRKELEKLAHAEVRVRLLHTGIGGITESDVQLALTSPEDTLILGFNVVPDDRAHALAEERGIKIRQYNIIYNLTDDIRAALEGKLKPREEVVHLGRAVVRQTFKISRVGTIAGCMVTQGVIERSAKIRLIRGGVVVYPPPDRTASLESLKRHKDDAREVREGFDCGMKIAGYDDIKVDDVIEAYRIEQIQRTLTSKG